MSAPRPLDEREQAAIKLYVGLMEETKARFHFIDMAISGRTGLPELAVREFCFLQLRMLCEVIALACLTANGNIKETQGKDLKSGTYADKIIRRLATLHKDFYPRPAIDVRTPDGIHLAPIAEPFLTRDDLIKLYGQCGNNVHRGSLKRLQSPQIQIPTQYQDIVEWTNKTVKLLDRHYITLSDQWTTIICFLKDQTGAVQVALARPPEST